MWTSASPFRTALRFAASRQSSAAGSAHPASAAAAATAASAHASGGGGSAATRAESHSAATLLAVPRRPQDGNGAAAPAKHATVGSSAPRPGVPYPARQNPFVTLASSSDDKVLLAKAQYGIFTIALDAAADKIGLYCATSNDAVVFSSDHIWKAALWVDERIGDEFIAGLVFPNSADTGLKKAVETLASKAMKRLVIAPDSWGITHMAFRAQKDAMLGATLPVSLEEASYQLSGEVFSTTLTEPPVLDIEGSRLLTSDEVKKPGVVRDAVLGWNVLFSVHRRFGTPGSRKALTPIDQIVRRVVKAVNVFVVDINVRAGRGTITEGYTMIVTIYDSQNRTQSIHRIRSLAEETAKLNALTTLLYGEGSSSISLFVPTIRTKSSQLVAFARTCRPKSPFFVAEISSLAPYFGGHNVAKGITEDADPRGTWATIRENCFSEKHTKKDEERMDRYLQRSFTALANKLFSDRLQKVSPAIMSAAGSIPAPTDSLAEVERVTKLAESSAANPVPPVLSSTFLNQLKMDSVEPVLELQQWRSKIYDSPERLERETKALEGVKRYLIVDLETTTIRRYKRIANPFTKENYVVLSGARDYKGNVFMPKRYFDRSVALRYDDPAITSSVQLVEKSSKDSIFFPPLDEYDVIVGHNIKFDLLHTWRDPELRKFLRRGGKIWDTMYGEYLLTGHEVRLGNGAGLEDVARSYGGQTPKLDAVKRAWAEGKETYEIPYVTLTEYLHGDLENTELIYRKHMERALVQRQVIICLARMDGLLCTTEMEYNGLRTNVELAVAQSNELVGKVTSLRRDLDEFIPSEIPVDCRKFFNWSSNQHLTYYFFGGRLKLNTYARESKQLPGEAFDRHTLFMPPETYRKEVFPNGVFMRPPIYSVGVSDCAIMAGLLTEKGTRIFKAYFYAYMRQAHFRKSSTLTDSLTREMIAIPRGAPERRGESAPLANLLQRRHLFLFAALSPDVDNRIGKFFVKNPITGESVTITTARKGKELEKFIRSQVVKHTDVLVPADQDSVSESANKVFTEAQVTILARDANFSFRGYLGTDPELVSFFDAHSGATEGFDGDKDVADRYAVYLADTVATLSYYKSKFGDESAHRSASKVPAAKAGKSGGKASATARTVTHGADSLAVIPAKALPPPLKSKARTSNVDGFRRMLLHEASMKPEEWCNFYTDVFLHIGNAALQREALEPTKTKKKSKKDEGSATDDTLPVLLRQRRAFVGYYNALPDAERKRLALMSLVGKTVSSAYDSFAVPCAHDDLVELDIKGRLSDYVPSELEAEQIMRRFRSATTRQLQVGEDTLQYFKKTHSDKTADIILELRGLEKLIGTYYESTTGGSGMVSLVHSIDSCIHHELIHNNTSTGRLSSANPNCQNIPKEDKSQLRDMFISRYGEKGMCIEADYSQLEVVALAVLANDSQMLDDLRHNVDFHCKRVTMMRPDLKYTDVLLRAKKNKEPEFVKLRQQAKIFSFQRQYGAGVRMISQSTGLTQDQVRMLIEKESETYRQVEVFNAMVTLSANTFDPTLQNGARNVKGHQLYKGMFPVVTGSRYIFTESDVPEGFSRLHRGKSLNSRKSTNFSPTHLKNYPVQGFAGEIVQVMLGVLWRKFYNSNNYNGLAVLTNTVHDCVWVDCHVSVYEQVARDVEATMSSVKSVLNALYPEMKVSVEFPCDVVAGESMGSLRPIVVEQSL